MSEMDDLKDAFARIQAAAEEAAAKLKASSAVLAQNAAAMIPAAQRCLCLCSVYEPHVCEGVRTADLFREIPGAALLGKQLPATVVPLCSTCHGANLRSPIEDAIPDTAAPQDAAEA